MSQEAENFYSLHEFLKNEPLENITISRGLHEMWRIYGLQTEDDDCNQLNLILEEVWSETVEENRKFCLKQLQDTDKVASLLPKPYYVTAGCNSVEEAFTCSFKIRYRGIRYSWNELKSLADADLFRFYEHETWKPQAIRNISSLKETISKSNTPVHLRLLEKINNKEINDLTYDDPLANGVIDLGCNYFQITEEEFDVLLGEKARIRKLNKESSIKNLCADFVHKRNEIQLKYRFILAPSQAIYHDRWAEPIYIREEIAHNILDMILQEIKMDLHQISKCSENTLVTIIGRLMDVAMCNLPVEFEVKVIRAEKQSIASKNRKISQGTGSRGNRPDLMIKAFFQRKWNELAYVESGKWKSNEDKIWDDYKSLVRFCIDCYDEISKKSKKEELRKFFFAFGINIASGFLIIHGLARENGTRFYLPIVKTKIPFYNEPVEDVENFIHALLVLRNGIIVNLQNLRNSFKKKFKGNNDNANKSPLHATTIGSPSLK
ncbi:10147_t:CDS:10 [Cetraspora pellucida]|uniref:10147_t:CDS:1 n=1 Tax=Cetraspora pellucida TaxID=1433469 RepID=A0A9N9HA98_9GLOM|nr:10147_t:CDS:10 [Cetraspora pellucida]